jgi:hypothetical protein
VRTTCGAAAAWRSWVARAWPLAILILGLLAPAASDACPVCFSGSDRSRLAFFGTTILMSLLPLGLIGSGLWWLRRRAGEDLSDEFQDRDSSS